MPARTRNGKRRMATALLSLVLVLSGCSLSLFQPIVGQAPEERSSPEMSDVSVCGGELVHDVYRGARYLGLRTVTTTGEVCRLTEGKDHSPVVSPDGSLVVFNSDASDTTDVIDLSAGLRWTILPFQVGGASWSPDSRAIAYVPPTLGGRSGLYVIDVRSGESRSLAQTASIEMQPEWSPEGRWIAFVADEDIYRAQADGQRLERLTDAPGPDTDPAWSPDGGLIAFSSSRDDLLAPEGEGPYTSRVHVMQADGSAERRLTRDNAPVHERMPLWSPDGRRIAFLRSCDDDVCDRGSSLVVVPADGGAERTLVPGGPPSDFVWGPTGRWVAYVERGPGGRSHVFKISMEGITRRLTSSAESAGGLDR